MYCLNVGGTAIENVVADAFLQAITPAAIEAMRLSVGFIAYDFDQEVIYYPVADQIWRVNTDGTQNTLLTSGAFPGYVSYGKLSPADATVPMVTSVTASPNPAAISQEVVLTATLTDTGGNLESAQYYVGNSGPNSLGTASAPRPSFPALCRHSP